AVDRSGSGGGRPANVQSQLAKALGLTFQLDGMDSSKANWRSCDMDVDELQKRLDEAGPNAGQLLKLLGGSSFLGQLAGFALKILAQSPQLSATVKMVVVEGLGHADDFLRAGGASASGPAGAFAGLGNMAKVLIDDRNNVVVRELRDVIANEKKV